jgi:hypothetical protein
MSYFKYQSPEALKKAKVDKLFDTNYICIMQEKLDGSQLSFYINDMDEITFMSRNQEVKMEDNNKLFKMALESIRENVYVNLNPEYIYRGECIVKPRHNVMTYKRVPKHGFVLFDIQRKEDKSFLEPIDVFEEALKCDLECVKSRFIVTKTQELPTDYLDMESMLGGPIEGVVFKNYWLKENEVAMYKHVIPKFEETREDLTLQKKNNNELNLLIAKSVCTEARWVKACQHLLEAGKELTPSNVSEEIKTDVVTEEIQTIMTILREHKGVEAEKYWTEKKSMILGACCRGLYVWLTRYSVSE